MRLPHTIETVTGVSFDYHDPEVNLDDVAHGLAHECRFGRQTSRFYSVAEHSVFVSHLVGCTFPEVALAALWHDAHEAYMGDLPTPLKALVGDSYRDVAARIDEEVCRYLALDPDECSLRHPYIKYADEVAMLYEASVLMNGPGWAFTRQLDHRLAKSVSTPEYLGGMGLAPVRAAELFKARHYLLTQGVSE